MVPIPSSNYYKHPKRLCTPIPFTNSQITAHTTPKPNHIDSNLRIERINTVNSGIHIVSAPLTWNECSKIVKTGPLDSKSLLASALAHPKLNSPSQTSAPLKSQFPALPKPFLSLKMVLIKGLKV